MRHSKQYSRLKKAGSSARPSLILASSSPRRRSLLAEYGYDFRVVIPKGVEEIAPGYLSPGETVLANAWAKARSIADSCRGELILAVDTEVFFEGRVIGKPATMRGAFQMLSRLNGRTHEVYSGVWVIGARGEFGCVEVSRVHFYRRSAAFLRRYLARIQPLDKAGAYAAQDDCGDMITRVEGSYTNVIGLPMERLDELLKVWR